MWEDNLKKLIGYGCNITLNITITNKVVGKEEDFIEIIKYTSVKSVHLGYYVPTGLNKENNLRPTHKEHSDFCINMVKLVKKHGLLDLKLSPIEGMLSAIKNDEFSGGVVCEIFNSLNIDTNGLVSLCTAVGGNNDLPEQVVGDITKEKINLIMKSKRYYKELLSMLNYNEHCVDCEYKHLCKQGCKILSNYGVEEGECWGYKRLWDFLSEK